MSGRKANPENQLGLRVHLQLKKLGIETPMQPQIENVDVHIRLQVRNILTSLGLDLTDDSLKETPSRVAQMFTQEVFWGLNYDNFPKMTTIENKMNYDEMIATSCSVKSICEHHLVPFMGIAHVAYIPKTKVLGLSKFNRLVDFFSRRPQVQERLTAQISSALQLILRTDDVAVVIKATHYCVHLRGVQDERSETVTSQVSGRFLKKPALRQEFLALTR